MRFAATKRLAATAFAATLLAGSWPALAGGPLAAHRAVYDIALKQANDRSGITGVAGRMVYEFNGSACEGYTVSFRFVTQIDTNETSRITDQQTTTYEDAAGKTFSFATKSFVDSRLDREVRGTANIEAGKTNVDLVKPDETRIELDKTLFPTQHLVDLLERASHGETFYETTIFDGSDGADQVMTTTVIVGKPDADDKSDPEKSALGTMGGQKYWPVTIAYFDPEASGGEELPVYRISFKLYANGITRSILMDYGDFSMTGKLVDLSVFDKKGDCG
ncbi:MAG: cell envelope integrity EipB family protein [Rhizobiaceae bacterium]